MMINLLLIAQLNTTTINDSFGLILGEIEHSVVELLDTCNTIKFGIFANRLAQLDMIQTCANFEQNYQYPLTRMRNATEFDDFAYYHDDFVGLYNSTLERLKIVKDNKFDWRGWEAI